MLNLGERAKYNPKPSKASEAISRRVPTLSRSKRKLDEENQFRVCAVIAAGYGMPIAVELTGCTRQAVHQLAQRDPEFHDALRSAYVRAKGARVRLSLVSRRGHEWAAEFLLNRLNQVAGGKKVKGSSLEERSRALHMSQELFEHTLGSRTTYKLIKEELKRLDKEDAKAAESEESSKPAKGKRS